MYIAQNLFIWVAISMATVFLLFGLLQLKSGRTHSARIERDGGSVLLSKFVMEFGYWLMAPLAKICVWLKISPNLITLVSLFLGAGSGIIFAYGEFALAGWVMAIGSLLDGLDGMVARARKVDNPAGGILDSTADRICEMGVAFGLIVYYRFDLVAMCFVFATLMGSILVSYASARGEIYQVKLPRGIMRRGERAVYLSLAAILAPWADTFITQTSGPSKFYLMQLVLLLVGSLALLSSISRYKWLYKSLKEGYPKNK